MVDGQFVVCDPARTRTSYSLLEATLQVSQFGEDCWLNVQASARPAEWASVAGQPEAPTIDLSVRIPGLEPALWMGREFVVPEGRDKQTGYHPAWLYYDEGYETMCGCLVSVGSRVGDDFRIRVVGRGVQSGCVIEVAGVFPLVVDGALRRT